MKDKDAELRALAAKVQAACTEEEELVSFFLELIPRFGLSTVIDCSGKAAYYHHGPLGDAISNALQEAQEEGALL